ncbi:MAG: hypothetical protein ABSA44_09660 [Bacteroidota bacterium]|jgi:hypothetical protein
MGQLTVLLGMLVLFGGALLIKKVTGGTVFPFAMTVLNSDRLTDRREGNTFVYGQEANHIIYKGAIVCLNVAGYAVEGSALSTLIGAGIADEQSDSTGIAQGVKKIRVKEGMAYLDNWASDLVTVAEIGDTCYVYDDHTVAKTATGGGGATRPIAGYVRDLDGNGVWVEFKNTHSSDGDVVAANNLSDVTALTARSNLGANLVALTLDVALLNGSAVYHIASPVAGHITKLQACLKAALTTGSPTLTGKIATVAITTGAFTLTFAGSAAGTIFALTPTGANTVAVGSDINFGVTANSQDAVTGCTVTILITTDV